MGLTCTSSDNDDDGNDNDNCNDKDDGSPQLGGLRPLAADAVLVPFSTFPKTCHQIIWEGFW